MTHFVFRAPGEGRERAFRAGGLIVPRGMLAISKASRPERLLNRRARERAAAALERDLADVLVRFREGITVEGAEAAVLAGNARVIVNAAAPNILEAQLVAAMGDHLEEALESGARIGFRFAPPALAGVSPGMATEAAVAYVERQAASAVVDITQSTQAGIQEIISLGLRDQLPPVEVARRIGKVAGLAPRQVRAVETFRAATTKRLAPVPEALTPQVQRVIDREVDRYRDRQLLFRGRTIAETETQAAITHGEQAFWDQGVSEGAVSAEDIFKTWRTVLDTRVCKICEPVHGQTVPYGETFITAAGGKIGPPAHPRCRCYVEYAEFPDAGSRPERARAPGEPGLPKTAGSFDPTEAFDPGMQAKTARLKAMDWPPGVTPAQHKSRVAYQGAAFGPINQALRTTNARRRMARMGDRMGPYPIKDHVTNLDGMLLNARPLPDDLTLYRGIKTKGIEEVNHFKNAKAGDVFTDQAYGSWSGRRATAVEFGEQGGVTLRMRAPAGSDAMYIGTVEEEFLIQRGTSYRVLDVEENVLTLKTAKREMRHTVVTVERVEG